MQLLITSGFAVAADGESAPAGAVHFDDADILVEHAQGDVCQRCRMTTTDVGADKRFPTLCGRCAKIVAENFPEAVENGFEA